MQCTANKSKFFWIKKYWQEFPGCPDTPEINKKVFSIFPKYYSHDQNKLGAVYKLPNKARIGVKPGCCIKSWNKAVT